MLDIMKSILGMELTDVSKDSVLNHYLSKAQLAILNYCSIDTIPESLNSITVDLAIFFYQNPRGITQSTQGSRSKSIVDGIPESIKACLPCPKLKVM